MGKRRTARELALQMAYAVDQGGIRPDQVRWVLSHLPVLDDEGVFDLADEVALARHEREVVSYFDDEDWEASKRFAEALVRGAWERLEEVDAAIVRAAEHWTMERMSAIDRTVLRLAAHELLFGETPPRAVLNEWIDVAKKFSTEQSGPFVNGILDRLLREKVASGRPAEPNG